MSTPTRDASNAAAIADKEALVTAANTKFINDATSIIAQQVAQGKFEVTLHAFEYVSLHDISVYFQALGYGVDLWRYDSYNSQPAALFGEIWDAYWNNRLICWNRSHRITISWGNSPNNGWCGP